MSARVMLRMPLAPELLAAAASLHGDAIGTWRLDLFPRLRRFTAADQHRTRRMTDEAFAYRTQNETLDAGVPVCPHHDQVRCHVACQLRNLDVGIAEPDVKHDPFDRSGQLRRHFLELRAHVVVHVRKAEDGLALERSYHLGGNHVNGMQFAAGQCSAIRRRSKYLAAALRKIDSGYDDAPGRVGMRGGFH
jgi:hypothetical protein